MQAFSDALHISPTLTITAWRPQFPAGCRSTAIVRPIYSATTALKPDLLVSAAVWPNYTSGYNSYYQDSKGWLANGIIDANLPMLYSSDIVNDLPAWTARAQGFLDDAHGRYVFPGISTNYTDVNQIINRIEAARSLGAQGVALFSYGALEYLRLLGRSGEWPVCHHGDCAETRLEAVTQRAASRSRCGSFSPEQSIGLRLEAFGRLRAAAAIAAPLLVAVVIAVELQRR